MSSINANKDFTNRYSLILALLFFLGVAIIGKTAYIMFTERNTARERLDELKNENLELKPTRGRILSSDGQLLASSLPKYKIYFDFKAGAEKKDSLLMASLDSIADGLHAIFPDRTAQQFRDHILEGRERGSRYWPIYANKRKDGKYSCITISYTQYKEMKKLPVFRMSNVKGGFIPEKLPNRREWPFGSLARRTLGSTTAETDSATSGIELAYDSVLRGKSGIYHTQRIRSNTLTFVDLPPENGADVVTTIDVSMQDICEKALKDQMYEIGSAYAGCAILMEVKTGDVKAIVSLSMGDDNVLRESQPHAIADVMEPGSTFKTASLMVALDDGKCDVDYMVDTGAGICMMHGAKMKDHNYARGGCGTISFAGVLMNSSNIGTSKIIERFYGPKKVGKKWDFSGAEKFVDGLYRIGIARDLKLSLREYHKPMVRRPNPKNWWMTTLPWMSIGYETQIPAINTLAFYNAIANGGKLMRPRFVKQVEKDGNIIRTYEPEVISEAICKPVTLTKMQDILRLVVKDGVGKRAGSKQFHVAGKTGTAQIAHVGGYHSGTMHYLVSFCGYFPFEDPQYTCIVAIQKRGTPASGGAQAGPVFKAIAERIYAKNLTKTLEEASDTLHSHMPEVMGGDMKAAHEVLKDLSIKQGGSGSSRSAKWGTAETTQSRIDLEEKAVDFSHVPDVRGMGAEDAVYLMEKAGIKVTLSGTGTVRSQSLAPGSKARGGHVTLTLRE